MTGMIEGVLGFEIFDLGIFGVGKFWHLSFNAPSKFLWLGNSAWDFWGLNVGPGIF